MFEKIEFFSQQSEGALKKIMEQIATKWDWKGHEISRICVQYLCYIKLTWHMGLFPSFVGTKLARFVVFRLVFICAPTHYAFVSLETPSVPSYLLKRYMLIGAKLYETLFL